MKNALIYDSSAKDYDLAVEAHRLLRGEANTEIHGVTQEIETYENGEANIIKIINEEGAAAMGRPIGSYITITVPGLRDDYTGVLVEPISSLLAKYLITLLPKPTSEHPLLVIGLGNWQTTPDALGPQVIAHTQPTNHIYEQADKEMQADLMPLCAFTPGVLGNTGIDTAAIVQGVVEKVKPCTLIVIDALAAASVSRICTTIQISNTGICPGSGIVNHNRAIDEQTMKVPVIAIGIPTVVNAKTIIRETLNTLSTLINSDASGNQKLGEEIAKKLLAAFEGELIVTPKEIDHLLPLSAKIIAAAIALAVHPGANKENYNLYMQ
mgnify:FL=1